MSDAFDKAFTLVVGLEGGYTDSPIDPGNWTGGQIGVGQCRGTKFGISAASFPAFDIKTLTIDQAKAIYAAKYWRPISGDGLPSRVALVVFDSAVNQGLGAAQRLLQQALRVTVDGAIGPATLAAATRYSGDPSPLILEIAARRAVRYALGDMTTFGLGWMRRLFTVTGQALLPS